jgi:hypothetical protein
MLLGLGCFFGSVNLALQPVAFECPELPLRILSSELFAEICIKIGRINACRSAGNRESVWEQES